MINIFLFVLYFTDEGPGAMVCHFGMLECLKSQKVEKHCLR